MLQINFTYLNIALLILNLFLLYAYLYNCYIFIERKFKCENNVNLLDMGVSV